MLAQPTPIIILEAKPPSRCWAEMFGCRAKNNALFLAQRVAGRQVWAWPADARLMSQESFHESWVAALASHLEGAAQKQRAKWGSARFNSCEALLLAARHAASTAADNFQKGAVDHHWQTRFYQQLSAVCVLAEMAIVAWRQLDDAALLKMDEAERKRWQNGWEQADLERLREMALAAVRSAWACARRQAAAPNVISDASDFFVAFPGETIVAESFDHFLRQILVPISSIRRPTGRINNTAWLRMYRASGELKTMINAWIHFPDPGLVAEAHEHIIVLQREMVDAEQTCAAARTTCKGMAATLSETWARLRLLSITPDTPGCRGQRPGAGYHQGHAWNILERQLCSLAGELGTQPGTAPSVCWSNRRTFEEH